MLEKPPLTDEKIVACLRHSYGLTVAGIQFLPIGADAAAGVYRVVAADQTPYFLKVKQGVFDEAGVEVPRFLYDQGIQQIIAPIRTTSHQLYANADNFRLILYPYIDGQNGFESHLTDRQWIQFGAALKAIHSAAIPAALRDHLQRETYSTYWREIVRMFLARAEENIYSEPVAAKLAAFLRAKREEILFLVGRAERLGSLLQAQSQEYVLCHSDIHAGNILVGANDRLYIVDWDSPILAPKERDLMFIGAGVGDIWNTPQEGEMFYQGYGQTEINPIALAYYRYERIVQDIAAYSEQLLLKDDGGEDRENAFRRVTGQFLPGKVIEIAYNSEYILPPDLRQLRAGNPAD